MYLHLGQNIVVPETDVIGVFDLDNTTGSLITRKFLGEAEKAGRVVSVTDELPKSFVVCSAATPKVERGKRKENGLTMKVYLSQLSSLTLLKRSETMRFEP